jgi:glyoxylase-like metal-dependent hydrolase (beta-lactamase superfamily II)
MTVPDASLELLADDVGVWLQGPPRHGTTNVGVVVEDDGITVVDTTISPIQAQVLVDQLAPMGKPVRRAVYTSSHIEFVGGSTAFWMAARYGRSLTSALLDQPPNPEALARLHPDHAAELAEPATRPVSHVIDAAAWLSARVCALPTAGQQDENLVVLVPEADVLFAGAMACFGATPNCFDGDPGAWADALGDLGETATRVVPGIGPVGGPDEVLALQAYLWSCVDAEGDPSAIPSGPWDAWTDRHLDEVNVERAALLAVGDRSVPTSMLRLLGLA